LRKVEFLGCMSPQNVLPKRSSETWTSHTRTSSGAASQEQRGKAFRGSSLGRKVLEALGLLAPFDLAQLVYSSLLSEK